MNREFTCLVCPKGCRITAVLQGKEEPVISGEGCKRGKAYVLQELIDPRRTISTSVRVRRGETDLASVRLTKPIPLDRVKEAAGLIQSQVLTAPVYEGTVILSDLLGLGSDVIVTRTVREAEGM